MIRRYYILPLRHGVAADKVDEFVAVLRAADRFIPGLLDSSAARDLDTPTVIWENTFVDEASYAGPYMVHPFHIGAIDNFVMADSPDCLTHDIFTMRYQTADATPACRRGIRRVLLLRAAGPTDAATLAALAASTSAMAGSGFGEDNIGWVSAKGRAFTHVWEQAFSDTDQLHRYLRSRDGQLSSSVEGFARLGVDLDALKIFTCPFELTPAAEQTPAPAPVDDRPVAYSITARLAVADVARYVALLEQWYDPFMAEQGCPLVERTQAVPQGFLAGEVRSTWQLDSLAHYSDVRVATYADPRWNAFVGEAMPLVRGGSRQFHHRR